MRLLAISDLHADRPGNRAALEATAPHPEDWLLVAGDVADKLEDVAAALSLLVARFGKVFWCPGNHELWSRPGDPLRGVARYEALVALCRELGVVSPEDPVQTWVGEGGPAYVVPAFLHYDLSLAPEAVAGDVEAVLAWAAEDRIRPRDEGWLHTEPHPSHAAWCAERLALTEARLAALDPAVPIVFMNHYALRPEHVRLFKVPRYTPWCGTRQTADWHRRFNIQVAISGHLHLRATDWLDGVRFEEVSLGYPRDWVASRGLAAYLRPVLPSLEAVPPGGVRGPRWIR